MSVNCIGQQEQMVSCSRWGGDYYLYHLRNELGTQVDISNLGATIVHFQVSDRDGNLREIVLGYEQPEEYLQGEFYIGGVVGPWANRIAQGHYDLDGESVQLDQNEGQNHLHGGSCQLHKRKWQQVSLGASEVTLKTKVKRGEGGYPANIDLRVTYRLSEQNELKIEYLATPDRPCPLNLTQHSYFNLSGLKNAVFDHELTLDAGQFWQVNDVSIPVDCRYVAETAMDFRQPHKLSERLRPMDDMLTATRGYDHCYMLNGKGFRQVAQLREPQSGLSLQVMTTESAIQLYTGNFLAETFQPWSGVCLETQCIPDQMNMPEFARQAVYSRDHPYRSVTAYRVVV